VAKHKLYTEQFKKTAVLAAQREGVSATAKRLKVHPSQIYSWRKKWQEATPVVTDKVSDARVYLRHASDELSKRMREGKIKKPDRVHLLALLALDALDGQ
jgi:transposase-like protein